MDATIDAGPDQLIASSVLKSIERKKIDMGYKQKCGCSNKCAFGCALILAIIIMTAVWISITG